MPRPQRRGLPVVSVVLLVCLTAVSAAAAPDPVLKAAGTVRPEAVMRQLRDLQRIADAEGGTRASGTPGYAVSRDQLVARLKSAGYRPVVQPFAFPFYREKSTASFERLGASPRKYRPTPPDGASTGEFATMAYSGAGEVTGPLRPVDLALPPKASGSTSGCEAADFEGFPRGSLALLQRGTCTFETKIRNARRAGAAAAVIFNEGLAGRTDVLAGSAGGPAGIPVLGTSFAVGRELAAAAGTKARIRTDTESGRRTTWNIIAETAKGDPDRVVMLGAHLDSVTAGPGVNDNASGSAALLEVALRAARTPARNRLRFAWWGAEELGLLGSKHYVGSLSKTEAARIRAYLNHDMVASPNSVYFILDGDDSDATGSPAGPAGSGEIEKVYERYFDRLGLPHKGSDFNGRSDYGPFIEAGIPSGGLLTGSEGIKTSEEATRFGGTAGKAYDPCYHRSCDTIANLDETALRTNLAAMAHAAFTFAAARDLPR